MGVRKYIPTDAEAMLIKAFIKLKYKNNKIDILVDRMVKEMSLREIAEKYGVTVNYVHLVEMELFKTIRKAMDIEWRERIDKYNTVKKI